MPLRSVVSCVEPGPASLFAMMNLVAGYEAAIQFHHVPGGKYAAIDMPAHALRSKVGEGELPAFGCMGACRGAFEHDTPATPRRTMNMILIVVLHIALALIRICSSGT